MSTVWKFGSTTLSTLGNITKLSDSFQTPPRRGDNIQVPYRDGRTFVKKFFDQRSIALGLALTEASNAAMETKIDAIKLLVGLRTQQVLEVTTEDAIVRRAYAEVREAVQVERLSVGVAKLVITFLLTDPFFRGSTLTTVTTTIDATPHAISFTNPGTVEERHGILTLNGPLENTVITNSTTGAVLSYLAAITNGHYVVINCKEFTAVDDAAANVIGNVTHSGDVCFMTLAPGANTLSVADDTHTTGTIVIDSYAPYL